MDPNRLNLIDIRLNKKTSSCDNDRVSERCKIAAEEGVRALGLSGVLEACVTLECRGLIPSEEDPEELVCGAKLFIDLQGQDGAPLGSIDTDASKLQGLVDLQN